MTVPDTGRPAAASEAWTVRRILDWTIDYLRTHGSETPRLDAEILLAHARDCRRIELYTRYDEPLGERERGVMRDLVKRRAQAEPVAYLVGHREFFSLDFRVTPDVLIPRPDTETLVMETLARAREMPSPRILDLCTGSGCVAVAMAQNHPAARLTATDLSAAALSIARENAERHGVAERIEFLHGDLFAPLDDGAQFDLIVSNPPYVREDEFEQLAPDIRLHEPAAALLAGADGLDVIRRLIVESPAHIAAGGRLLFEIDPAQAEPVRELFASPSAFGEVQFLKDLAGQIRVVLVLKQEP